MDPYDQYANPYVGMGNDPMNGVDEDGGLFGVNVGLLCPGSSVFMATLSAAWKTFSPIAGLIANGINITNNSIKVVLNYKDRERINGQAETQGVGADNGGNDPGNKYSLKNLNNPGPPYGYDGWSNFVKGLYKVFGWKPKKYRGPNDDKDDDYYDDKLASIVERLVGKPYKWGEAGPDGFDCSGTICYAIKQISPKFGRYTADDIFNKFTTKTNSQSRGKLKFYDYTSDGHIDHVTTLVNNNMMIHPSQGAGEIQLKESNYLDKYTNRQGGSIYLRRVNWKLIIKR